MKLLENQTFGTISQRFVWRQSCLFISELFIMSQYSLVTVCSWFLNMYYSSGRCWIIGFLKRPWRLSCLLAALKHTICLQSQPKLGDLETLSFVRPLINRTGVNIHPETLDVLKHSNFHICIVVIEATAHQMSHSHNSFGSGLSNSASISTHSHIFSCEPAE